MWGAYAFLRQKTPHIPTDTQLMWGNTFTGTTAKRVYNGEAVWQPVWRPAPFLFCGAGPGRLKPYRQGPVVNPEAGGLVPKHADSYAERGCYRRSFVVALSL